MVDLSLLRAFDTETYRFRPGELAPKIVCGSAAKIVDGKFEGELLKSQIVAWITFKAFLDAGFIVAYANAAYDLAVLSQTEPVLLPAVFRALQEGRVHDVLIAQALDAIAGGHLGANPDGRELRKPSTGEVTKRYSLEVVTDLVLGRTDAKMRDDWRESYALLDGIPVERWPAEACDYPIDDAKNTLEVAVAQIVGRKSHEWVDLPEIPGMQPATTACKYCGEELTFSAATPQCSLAPPVPYRNLENLPAQVEAAFALHLGACHSLRTDPERVEKLAIEVEAKHKVAVERFQKKGWIREDGSEDQAAVKRAIVSAYGASRPCFRCRGTGKIRKVTEVDCRGEKIKGRYRGCNPDDCKVCHGSGKLEKQGDEVTCKNVFDDDDRLLEEGCDGSGFDLSTLPMLPRTDKLGVKTDRDSTMESGDEDLADYGENEFEKSRTTYVPYLRTGIVGPLNYSPNVLVATGRCSYEGSPLHQMPRNGGERGCIRARGAWCGYPVEMVLGSTDYSAGELCTLAQLTYWLFGYSRMRDAINKSGDPGILHSELAAEVMGISLEDFLVRLKAKDKQAIDFRQASKPENFGKPAAMGSPKIVLTNRKKNAGFTPCEGGPARNAKGQEGYWGIRFCILIGGAKRCGIEKITEWKKYPCAPVCKKCVEIEYSVLSPAYFRRFPEIKDYHKWATKMTDNKEPAPCAIWDAEAGKPKIVRERGGCDFSAYCNNGFQGMLADIGKDAFVVATRECYLGVKNDGSPSPLGGSRLPLFVHDEPVSELILDTAYLSGPRIADIMMESGRKMAPDVVWKAETALAFYWNKSMEPVYKDGKLTPWEPGN